MQYTEKDRHLFTKSAEKVAPWLLGKTLCHRLPGGEVRRLIITEVEAYPGTDTACYGVDKEGKKHKTKDNAPLFEEGGSCFVFADMLLIVCGKKDSPDNVLIREVSDGIHAYSGPVVARQVLGIGKEPRVIDLLAPDPDLWLEASGNQPEARQGVRVRLSKEDVKPEDQKKEYRFYIPKLDRIAE